MKKEIKKDLKKKSNSLRNYGIFITFLFVLFFAGASHALTSSVGTGLNLDQSISVLRSANGTIWIPVVDAGDDTVLFYKSENNGTSFSLTASQLIGGSTLGSVKCSVSNSNIIQCLAVDNTNGFTDSISFNVGTNSFIASPDLDIFSGFPGQTSGSYPVPKRNTTRSNFIGANGVAGFSYSPTAFTGTWLSPTTPPNFAVTGDNAMTATEDTRGFDQFFYHASGQEFYIDEVNLTKNEINYAWSLGNNVLLGAWAISSTDGTVYVLDAEYEDPSYITDTNVTLNLYKKSEGSYNFTKFTIVNLTNNINPISDLGAPRISFDSSTSALWVSYFNNTASPITCTIMNSTFPYTTWRNITVLNDCQNAIIGGQYTWTNSGLNASKIRFVDIAYFNTSSNDVLYTSIPISPPPGPTIQSFNLTFVPVNATNIISVDVDTGTFTTGSGNTATDLQYYFEAVWCTNNTAKANHFYENDSADFRHGYLYNVNNCNPVSGRTDFSGNSPSVGENSNPFYQNNNVYIIRTSLGKYALVKTLQGNNGVTDYLNISIQYQTNGSIQFTNTIFKLFNGIYSYAQITPASGIDLFYGYGYGRIIPTVPSEDSNYTDLNIEPVTANVLSTFRQENNPNGDIISTIANLTGQNYATADNACLSLPDSAYQVLTSGSNIQYIPDGTNPTSNTTYCIRAQANTYKLHATNSFYHSESACVVPTLIQGKVETSGANSVAFSFATRNYTVNGVPVDCDFIYATASNTFGTCGNTTEKFYDRNYVNGIIRNDRASDRVVLRQFNEVSCDIVRPYAIGFETGIDQPVVGGADAPYPQDTFCFNLTNRVNSCDSGQIFGAIRVLRTGTYCLGFLNCPTVFDFYWKIYTQSGNFTFGPTSFNPSDTTTASNGLLLSWNTSAPGIPSIIYNILLPSGTTTANATILSPNGSVANRANSLAFVSPVQTGFYTYWLVANTAGGVFESEQRNFTVGFFNPSSQAQQNLNPALQGLESTGFCSGDLCGWYIGFIIWIAFTIAAWYLGDMKLGLGVALGLGTVEAIFNLLPQILLIPVIVFVAIEIVKRVAPNLAGGASE